MNKYTWSSEVRAHEIDAQGIVNNAHYLCYFDQARTLHIRELGIDWVELSKQGLNLVLANANIRFLKPLRPFQSFEVSSSIEREGKVKLIFNQTISNSEGTLVCTGINTIVCVDNTSGRPVAIDKISGLLL